MTGFTGGAVARWINDQGVAVAEIDTSGNMTLQGALVLPNRLPLSVDPSANNTYFDDFLGDTIRAEHDTKLGSGTGNALALVGTAQNGRILITTASDTPGADTLTFTAFSGPNSLSYRADAGGLAMEARLFLSAATTVCVFMGFTDTLPSAGLVVPVFFTNATDTLTGAPNAVGVLYDTNSVTKLWAFGGRKASASTAAVFAPGSANLPVASTFDTIRIEVDAAGTAQGFLNGTKIGQPVANAVTVTTPLVPVIYVGNRTNSARTCTVDYITVKQNR